jgi:hypothetical protein
VDQTNTDFILLVGSHGSGKSATMTLMTNYCTIRPLAFFFSCHPDFRELLFQTFFSEIRLYSWDQGGIIFADEYGDNEAIELLIDFILTKNGRVVLSCHPNNVNELMAYSQNFEKKEVVDLESLELNDAELIWRDKVNSLQIQSELNLWEDCYRYSCGKIGTYISLLTDALHELSISRNTNIHDIIEKFTADEKYKQNLRAGLTNRAYVVRYVDGTETRHRAFTPSNEFGESQDKNNKGHSSEPV